MSPVRVRAAAASGRPPCFNDLHALLIGAILAHLDFLDEQIDRLSDAIEERISPFASAVDLLCTIPGVQRRTAEVIIAEIGPDMTVFPSARHLASRAGQCPGNDRSAGKQRSGRTARDRDGSTPRSRTPRWPRSAPATVTCARSTKRQRSRIGHGKAIGAVKHSIIVATWHMLTTGELYADLGPDYYRRRDPARTSASSPSSNASATPSPSRRQPHRARTRFPLSGRR